MHTGNHWDIFSPSNKKRQHYWWMSWLLGCFSSNKIILYRETFILLHQSSSQYLPAKCLRIWSPETNSSAVFSPAVPWLLLWGYGHSKCLIKHMGNSNQRGQIRLEWCWDLCLSWCERWWHVPHQTQAIISVTKDCSNPTDLIGGTGWRWVSACRCQNDCTAKSSTPALRIKNIVNFKMLQRTVWLLNSKNWGFFCPWCVHHNAEHCLNSRQFALITIIFRCP